ncbi:hypothetical protein H696_02734 [Fonticula alba]|uniref:FCP1 homology domain-containing protein n=1 Tax=Fonticula alba TaxID=691883 RepID=A0A058Z8Z2_FONAL|nr:hypothetical protein H696_02734 [Fonticula alba]KCV70398.1 hypothetical protein H696_02734 [Fonticula alba]|eukprot:XP_009494914.1 hypothetical protein H696_02734 [Fonticula alba]
MSARLFSILCCGGSSESSQSTRSHTTPHGKAGGTASSASASSAGQHIPLSEQPGAPKTAAHLPPHTPASPEHHPPQQAQHQAKGAMATPDGTNPGGAAPPAAGSPIYSAAAGPGSSSNPLASVGYSAAAVSGTAGAGGPADGECLATSLNLLGDVPAHRAGRKVLVLDLDETLVHSSFRPVDRPDFSVPVEIEGQTHRVHVRKRPYVDAFLLAVAKHYEVVVYTASLAKYADPVLDRLDPTGVITSRLFREACSLYRDQYVKDLSRLGRPLGDCILIDNSPASYAFHPAYSIPITTWLEDHRCSELLELLPLLIEDSVHIAAGGPGGKPGESHTAGGGGPGSSGGGGGGGGKADDPQQQQQHGADPDAGPAGLPCECGRATAGAGALPGAGGSGCGDVTVPMSNAAGMTAENYRRWVRRRAEIAAVAELARPTFARPDATAFPPKESTVEPDGGRSDALVDLLLRRYLTPAELACLARAETRTRARWPGGQAPPHLPATQYSQAVPETDLTPEAALALPRPEENPPMADIEADIMLCGPDPAPFGQNDEYLRLAALALAGVDPGPVPQGAAMGPVRALALAGPARPDELAAAQAAVAARAASRAAGSGSGSTSPTSAEAAAQAPPSPTATAATAALPPASSEEGGPSPAGEALPVAPASKQLAAEADRPLPAGDRADDDPATAGCQEAFARMEVSAPAS